MKAKISGKRTEIITNNDRQNPPPQARRDHQSQQHGEQLLTHANELFHKIGSLDDESHSLCKRAEHDDETRRNSFTSSDVVVTPIPTMIRPLFIALALISSLSAKLSPEGNLQKAAHDFLFGPFLKNKEITWANPKVPAGKRNLKRLVIARPELVISGEAIEITLPPGTEKVSQFFRYFELHGNGIDQLAPLRLIPVAPESALNRSAQTPVLFRVKVPALPTPDSSTPLFKLTTASPGKATIKEIHLVPFGKGLQEEFDDLPFRNLGHDQPTLQLSLRLDPNQPLSLAGHTHLDRTRFFRYYGRPMSLPASLEKWAIDRNFTAGRQMYKIAPGLEHGYGNPKLAILKEDPNKPGHPAPDFSDKLKPRLFKGVNKRYGPNYQFAMCLNDYPTFQSRHPGGRGTPKVEHFEKAADLAALYLEKEIAYSGRTATWWEVKNEATIKAEWDYHFTREGGQPVDSWKLMADFHNAVAQAVHKRTPGVKIGGPASAWMQLQVNDFGLWKNQTKFMDLTQEHLDFYSHHFYEDAQSLGAAARLPKGYNNYLLGRLEALLDMFAAYGHATDNVKPFLITEYGALNIGNSETDYWLRLRSYSAYLTRFLKRPHEIDLSVPFIFLASPWDPTNGHAVFVPNSKGYPDHLDHYELTPCQHFFNLWRDFRGQYLQLDSPHPHLETVAVRDGRTLYLALSNMSCKRLSLALPGVEGVSTQRRLYRLDGKIRYRDADSVELSAIPLEAEETSILIIQLAENTPLKPSLKRSFHHSPQLLVKKTGILKIEAPTEAPTLLKLGIHSKSPLNDQLPLTFNGQPLTVRHSEAPRYQEFFAHFSAKVPAELLQRENTLEVPQLPEGVSITSAHLVSTKR
ncbi:MAG: beta-agarase [Akkermansiaceae bacterium]